eukprot:gb/GECG01008841.1/.p1 GENE.gb/GECG01008841.1/~~gb/GECG01008841.1/.p1  ORF type:complete len:459 (+),score=86.15 gb/GECG01008841.1/:1-1377(+)
MASVEQTQAVFDQAKELFETGKELFEPHTSSTQHGKGTQQGEKAAQKKEKDAQQGKQKLEQAKELFERVLRTESEDEELQKLKEIALYRLGDINSKLGNVQALVALLKENRPFFAKVAKAKTAKIVRTLIDMVARIPNTLNTQIQLCEESIEWCRAEKRSFLRLRIQTRLASLLVEQEKYQDALVLINSLLTEVKKLDDKSLLLEIHLVESKTHYYLRNAPKSRAALTAARTAANAIYVPPEMQVEIDMQAGTLHAEEKDYRTSYSYFFEAFEGLRTLDDPRAMDCLKYMILTKVMTGNVDDASSLLNGKYGVQYAGRNMEALRAVNKAYQDRSLHDFENTLKEYHQELQGDHLINRHLSFLNNMLLEQNLTRIIEPFSCVEINHVAELIALPYDRVESKLAEMILDKKLSATLDQGQGQLVVFDEIPTDKTYTNSLETIRKMDAVMDALAKRAEHLK